ncbi:hypothetical protein GCM10028808_40080 [Spirosoma migulaei]
MYFFIRLLIAFYTSIICIHLNAQNLPKDEIIIKRIKELSFKKKNSFAELLILDTTGLNNILSKRVNKEKWFSYDVYFKQKLSINDLRKLYETFSNKNLYGRNKILKSCSFEPSIVIRFKLFFRDEYLIFSRDCYQLGLIKSNSGEPYIISNVSDDMRIMLIDNIKKIIN